MQISRVDGVGGVGMVIEVLAPLTVPLMLLLPPGTGEKLFLDQMSNVPVPLSVFFETLGLPKCRYMGPKTV